MGTPFQASLVAATTLKDNGETLEVRGYVGAPMFGRSQTWVRQE